MKLGTLLSKVNNDIVITVFDENGSLTTQRNGNKSIDEYFAKYPVTKAYRRDFATALELTIQTKIHVTTHSGQYKLAGMHSISGSALENDFCARMRLQQDSVCAKCYGCAQEKRYRNQEKTLVANNELLRQPLRGEEIPIISDLYFRFDSFGELINITHLDNYVRICRKYPRTTFTLWTKRRDLLQTYFTVDGHEKPDNLIIGISSCFVNRCCAIETSEREYVNFTFTVYTADFAIKNNINVNCGKRKCLECLKCYTKANGIVEVNEILKKDISKYENAMSKKVGDK